MKAVVHCVWLALVACGGSDHTTAPAAAEVETRVLQKANEACRADGSQGQAPQADGSIALCADGTPATSPVAGTGTGGG